MPTSQEETSNRGGGSGGVSERLENASIVLQMCCVQTEAMAVKLRVLLRGRAKMVNFS